MTTYVEFLNEFRDYYRAARSGVQPMIGRLPIHRAVRFAWQMARWAVKHGH